ncbi:MAG: DUF5615 family PIN-like protein [Candidatus Aenigmarchaeota archaeon]|nr:DUF5615 family PIN-like protein [Candidatus Aenigmarchaeota archaeon]
MKFLIDADLPYSLIETFKTNGHEAVHVRDVLGSAPDNEIFEYANRNQYIIATRDLGFADMFIKRKGFGLLLFRLPHYFTANKIKGSCESLLKEIDPNKLVNSITVLELGRYRTRRL